MITSGKLRPYLTAIFLLFGCSGPELESEIDLPPGIRGNQFKVYSKKEEKEILSELEARGIPFDVDESGYVHYLMQNHAEVLGIKREASFGPGIDPGFRDSIPLLSDTVKNKYTSELTTQNIPFDIRSKDGVEFLYWSHRYSREVDLIRQKINLEILQE